MRTEPSNQKSLEVDGQKETQGSLKPKSMKSNWLIFLSMPMSLELTYIDFSDRQHPVLLKLYCAYESLEEDGFIKKRMEDLRFPISKIPPGDGDAVVHWSEFE